MARVLVTGGEGFIGRHLCDALLARGDEVVVIGRPGPMRPDEEIVGPGHVVLRLHLSDRAALAQLFRRSSFDVVYHLAARTRRLSRTDMGDWIESLEEDVAPLVTLLAVAATAPRPPRAIVRAGTIAEYGNVATPYVEAGPTRPTSAYGAALLSGTNYILSMASLLPFPVATARLALTYGPGQSTAFLAARLMSDLPAGRDVKIERPEDRRDLIHVADVVEGLMRIEGLAGIYNISTNSAPTMRELAETVCRVCGQDAGPVRFGRMDGAPSVLRCDNQKLFEATGWRPSIPLEAGIARTIAASAARGGPRVIRAVQ